MADISELIIEVKQINKTLSDIGKVKKALYDTSKEAKKLNSIGKTLFSGWGLTKVFGMVKKFGDSWKDVQVTFRNFDTIFGKWNTNAIKATDRLSSKLHYTEVEAKKLMAIVGSRISMFDFNEQDAIQISETLSKLATEIGQFYNQDKSLVLDKLTGALAGQTKALKQYGINIDTTSSKFIEMVKKIKEVKHETEENAKALAIYDRILRQSKQYEGTFSAQEKGLSQAISDIAETLKNGVFAQAGEILSKSFVPVLEKLNKLLSLNWVKQVGGFTLAVATIFGGLKLLKGAISFLFSSVKIPTFGIAITSSFMKVKALIYSGSILISYALGKFFASLPLLISSKLTGLFRLLSGPIAQKIAINLSSIFLMINKTVATALVLKYGTLAAFIATGITTAIIGTLLVVFHKDIAKLSRKLYNWLDVEFAQFIQSLFNYFAGAGFEANQTKFLRYKKDLDNVLFTQFDVVTSLEKEVEELDKQLKKGKQKKLNPEEEFEQIKEKMSDLNKSLAFAESDLNKNKEVWKRFRNRLLQKYNQTLIDQWEQLKIDPTKNENPDVKKLTEYQKKYQDSLDKVKKLRKEAIDSTLQFYNLEETIRKSKFDTAKFRFEEINWFWNNMNSISEAIGKFSIKDKIKHFDELIDAFKLEFSGLSLTPEEAKERYKELSNLEMEKFKAEMDGLNKEREFISTTNDLIKDYLERALQWTAQGIEGIKADTAEGYKFMTSGLSNLSSLGPVMKDSQSQQIELQKKSNDIAEKTKDVIKEISRQVDLLQGKTDLIKFNVIN